MLVIMHYALFISHYAGFGTHYKLSNFWVASDSLWVESLTLAISFGLKTRHNRYFEYTILFCNIQNITHFIDPSVHADALIKKLDLTSFSSLRKKYINYLFLNTVVTVLQYLDDKNNMYFPIFVPISTAFSHNKKQPIQSRLLLQLQSKHD